MVRDICCAQGCLSQVGIQPKRVKDEGLFRNFCARVRVRATNSIYKKYKSFLRSVVFSMVLWTCKSTVLRQCPSQQNSLQAHIDGLIEMRRKWISWPGLWSHADMQARWAGLEYTRSCRSCQCLRDVHGVVPEVQDELRLYSKVGQLEIAKPA